MLTLDYFNLRLQNFRELLDILNMENLTDEQVTAFEAKVSIMVKFTIQGLVV